MIPNDVVIRCTELKDLWSTRKMKFDDWYDIILLEDELEQEGVESVVSNDPRTSFNLAKHLLTSMTIADKIPTEGLPPEFITGTSYFEKFTQRQWKNQERRYRHMGRKTWQGEMVGWLLALGWYSVFAMVDEHRVWAEVWSPYECFPMFDNNGLCEHAHVYSLSPAVAKRKIKAMGWPINTDHWKLNRWMKSDIIFYDLWFFDDDGDACNAVVVDGQFAKMPQKDLKVSKTGRLPIFTSAVGGLPDMGSIKPNKEWQKHYGEPLCATNEDITLQYNKMRSFVQQAARSAAEPHWLELSSGDSYIATEELMSQWGSVLHGSPGDMVTALQSTPIPIELTSALYLYQNEAARGSLPNSLFGILEKSMSYLSMANVAASAMQILLPYRDAIIGLRTDINNFWQDMILTNNFTPNGFILPKVLPEREEMLFEVSADIDIPGQLIQKATLARMMNPNYRLPQRYVTEKIFPDIQDPMGMMAEIRSEDSLMHPKAKLIDTITAFRDQAKLLRVAGNREAATMYEKAAQGMEQELTQVKTEMPEQQGIAPTPMASELGG
jgi:hypothetical protein